MFTKKRLLILPLFTVLLAFSCALQKDDGKSGGNVAQEKEEPVEKEKEKREDDRRKVKIFTDYGEMTVVLYNETPEHRDNFVKLVETGFYDSLLFHRVMNNFMIQGGDPDSKNAQAGARLGNGGPGYTIPAEFDTTLYHKKGALAAARKGDRGNPQKRSSGSQFYIVHGQVFNDPGLDKMEMRLQQEYPGFRYSEEQRETYKTIGGTPHLDMGYTVFGEVVEGLNVVDSIAAVQTDKAARPEEDVRMRMELIE